MSSPNRNSELGIGIGVGAVASGVLVILSPISQSVAESGAALIFAGLAVTIIYIFLGCVRKGAKA